MLDVSIMRVVRVGQHIRNRNNERLTIVLEPWGERFDLAPGESMDVTLIGPDSGQPESLPYPDRLVIYGWEGCEFVALRDGRLATRPATVVAIVRQEFKISRQRLTADDTSELGEVLVEVQNGLDSGPKVNPKSQELACISAGHLVRALALRLDRSPETETLLWQIADRVVRLKGLVLAPPKRSKLEISLWSSNPFDVGELICRRAISALPGPLRPWRSRHLNLPTRLPSDESGSDSIPL